MRVISGVLKSRIFDSPKGHRTHPMSEKMRGGIFNVLGDISGTVVLDCFSGSGALAIEAISRGAASAVAVDSDIVAYKTIVKNIQDLSISGKISVARAKISSWSKQNLSSHFDIIFCDPPYDAINEDILEKLVVHLKARGIIVFSLPPRGDIRLPENVYKLVVSKSYGDSKLLFYRKV